MDCWSELRGESWILGQLPLSNYSEIILNDHKCVIKVQRIITTATTRTTIIEGKTTTITNGNPGNQLFLAGGKFAMACLNANRATPEGLKLLA